MIYSDSNCVGCEVCRGCGRNRKYTVWECDECGKPHYSESDVVEIKEKQYCERCYERLFGEEAV